MKKIEIRGPSVLIDHLFEIVDREIIYQYETNKLGGESLRMHNEKYKYFLACLAVYQDIIPDVKRSWLLLCVWLVGIIIGCLSFSRQDIPTPLKIIVILVSVLAGVFLILSIRKAMRLTRELSERLLEGAAHEMKLVNFERDLDSLKKGLGCETISEIRMSLIKNSLVSLASQIERYELLKNDKCLGQARSKFEEIKRVVENFGIKVDLQEIRQLGRELLDKRPCL